jgi:hypothetical protein
VNLLKWIEKYEKVLQRAGIVDTHSLETLKTQAKMLLPDYLDFLKN